MCQAPHTHWCRVTCPATNPTPNQQGQHHHPNVDPVSLGAPLPASPSLALPARRTAHTGCTRMRGLSYQPWHSVQQAPFHTFISLPSPSQLGSTAQPGPAGPAHSTAPLSLSASWSPRPRERGSDPSVFWDIWCLMPCIQRLHSPCSLPGGGRGRGQGIHSNARELAKHMNVRPPSGSGTWEEDRGHRIWLVRCQHSEDLWMLPPPARGREGRGGGIAGVKLKTGGNIIKIWDKHKPGSDPMVPEADAQL